MAWSLGRLTERERERTPESRHEPTRHAGEAATGPREQDRTVEEHGRGRAPRLRGVGRAAGWKVWPAETCLGPSFNPEGNQFQVGARVQGCPGLAVAGQR